MVLNKYLMIWRVRGPAAAAFVLALLAGGCTAGGGIGAPPVADTQGGASSSSFTDKISGFFSSSSARSPQTVAGAQSDVNCPFIDIRQGASTLTIGATGDNAAMSLKYQGTFVRAARECAVSGGNVVMRVGIQGRVIVGPAGGPGQVDVPLRIAVVQETTAGSRPIVTKLVRIPVAVGAGDENTTFTHIEEGLAFPMPRAADLDNYVIYIGFDPIAAQAQDKQQQKPRPRTRAGRSSTN